MASQNPEADPRVQLGALLKAARELADGQKTQEGVARGLTAERSTIGKYERGESVPSAATLAQWLDLLKVNGLARLAIEKVHQLARLRENPERVQVAPWFSTEEASHTLRYWAPMIVPGIAQTPAYAEELFRAMKLSPEKITEYMDIRLGRQAILTRDEVDVTIVIWEYVLHHQIGTPEVMHEQIARLLEISHLPTVALHVLPGSLGANPGLGGAINLAATHDMPELLLSDSLVTDQLSQEPAVVRKASATFNSVRADSFNRADSRTRLTEAMERWSD